MEEFGRESRRGVLFKIPGAVGVSCHCDSISVTFTGLETDV